MATIRSEGEENSSSSIEIEQILPAPKTEKVWDVNDQNLLLQPTNTLDAEANVAGVSEEDVFGNEHGADVQYKTCEWYASRYLSKYL